MQSEKNATGQYRQSRMYYFGVIILTIMAGCGKPSITKSSPSSNTTNSSTQLDGTWLGSCEVDEGDASSKSDFVVSGSSVTLTTRYYSGGNCATENSVSVYSLNYSIGGPAASPAGAVEVQQTLSKIMITLKTQQGVTTANEGVKWEEQVIMPPTCNGGFTINVPKELNPTVCAGDLLYGSMFGTAYGIIKIDGDKLYFGETDETNDGSTAAKRPTKLQSSYLTKQTSGSGGGTSLTVLEGTWVSGCDPDDPSDPQSQYSRSTITVSGSTATNAISSFSDGTCTESSAETLYVFTSSFTIGGPVSTPSGASKIDFLTSTLDLTVKNSDLLDAYNNGADFNNDGTLDMPPTCQGGFSLNQPKRLDASECATDQISSSFFGSTFSIFKIEDGKLYLGESDDDHDGSSDGNRPVIFPSTGFVKQ
jgi:hypothetical protein